MEECQQLVLGVNSNQSSNQSPRPSSSDDPGQKTLQMQCLHHAKVTQSKDRSALKNQCRPSEGLASIVQQLQLRLGRKAALVDRGRLQCRHMLDGARNLGDIFGDQELRADVGMDEELGRRDIAQVPYQARPKQIDEIQDVIVPLGRPQGFQSSLD